MSEIMPAAQNRPIEDLNNGKTVSKDPKSTATPLKKVVDNVKQKGSNVLPSNRVLNQQG